jgi:hypothetical protein
MQESIGLEDPVPGQKRSAGRPTKKTKAVTDRLFAAIERGMPYAMACELSGISEAVFYQWRQDPAFDAQVVRRTTESVFELLDTIKEARHQNWQAAAFLLERRWPRYYGRAEAQLNFEVAITNNTLNQVNNTLVVTAEIADTISSRVKDVDAKIERLLKDKRGGNGATDFPEVPANAMISAPITMPVGDPSPGWWAQLSQGDNSRTIAKEAAVFVCGTLVREVLGGLAAQSTTVEFDSEVVTLRDLHSVVQDLMGSRGWSALLRKGDRDV